MIVMATKIRGTTDDTTRMMLGQIRKVFDPDWIQAFGDKGFLIEFHEEPKSEKELTRFAEMYGFSLEKKEEINWMRYRFK